MSDKIDVIAPKGRKLPDHATGPVADALPVKSVRFTLPLTDHAALRRYCFDHGINMADFCRDAVRVALK